MPYLYCIRKPCKAQREKTGGFALFEPGKRNLRTFVPRAKPGAPKRDWARPGGRTPVSAPAAKKEHKAQCGALVCPVSYVIMKKRQRPPAFSRLGGRRGASYVLHSLWRTSYRGRALLSRLRGGPAAGGSRGARWCAAAAACRAAGPGRAGLAAARICRLYAKPAAQSCKNTLAGCILCAGV